MYWLEFSRVFSESRFLSKPTCSHCDRDNEASHSSATCTCMVVDGASLPVCADAVDAQPHMWQIWESSSNGVQVTWRRVGVVWCDRALLNCIILYVCVFHSMCVCKMSVRQFENVAGRCVKLWSRSCLRPGRQTTCRQTLRCLTSEAHAGHHLSLSRPPLCPHPWHAHTHRAPSSCRCNKYSNRAANVLCI